MKLVSSTTALSNSSFSICRGLEDCIPTPPEVATVTRMTSRLSDCSEHPEVKPDKPGMFQLPQHVAACLLGSARPAKRTKALHATLAPHCLQSVIIPVVKL